MKGVQGLPARGLKPAAELAATRAHGDRLRYIGGCRCDDCRRANTTYEKTRAVARKQGDWNGVVSAKAARKHLNWLSYHGVGRRAVGAATDIADSILFKIISGERESIRARTERKILSVTTAAAADHSLIPAGPTWTLIGQLIKAGFTKTQIAIGLGYKTPALQISKSTVTVRNAFDVEKLHARMMASGDALVPAKETLRLIARLREEGFTDKRLEREFGFGDGALTIPKTRVARKVAQAVAAFYERSMQ